ncbi:hypothetical protein R1flu_005036 [Riccia fluitans]|uniref:Uncharacterized protein n=1 Tax=Riccia fluitans TaxID=41844 RepID=A0ABD1YS06_9MARC
MGGGDFVVLPCALVSKALNCVFISHSERRAGIELSSWVLPCSKSIGVGLLLGVGKLTLEDIAAYFKEYFDKKCHPSLLCIVGRTFC